jgi:hypothetical protein
MADEPPPAKRANMYVSNYLGSANRTLLTQSGWMSRAPSTSSLALRSDRSVSHCTTISLFPDPSSSEPRDLRRGTKTTIPKKPTNLEDDDPEVFANYVRGIYLNLIDVLPQDRENSDLGSLIRLYVLADKLCDLKSANMVVDRLVCYSDETKSIPGAEEIELAYNSTASGSPLKAVFCDYFIHESGSGFFNDQDVSKIPREFYHDIAVRYLNIKSKKNKDPSVNIEAAFFEKVSAKPRCIYHQHDSKVPLCTPSRSAVVEKVPIT